MNERTDDYDCTNDWNECTDHTQRAKLKSNQTFNFSLKTT